MKGKRLLSYALRLLGRRDYTRAEMLAHLMKMGDCPEEVENVIEFLEKKRYLNDEQLAVRLIEEQLGKGRGLWRIRALLERRGLKHELIDKLMDSFDFEKELRAARDYLRKRLAQRRKISVLTLRSRGFSSETMERLRKFYHDS
ncbi:MAG TPA: RecX family transcriptional regulator, partial [bacterium]|nr:RecX family transcriptional regulator [bacterium]